MGWLLLSVLICVYGYVMFGCGMAYQELRFKKREKKVAEALEKARKLEEGKVEKWGEDGAVKFVSVPRAVTRANASAKDLLLSSSELTSFARFCREGLELELRHVELVSWTMIEYSEHNSWVRNPSALKCLREAIREEGFEVSYSEPEDGNGVGRIFIRLRK